MSRQPRRQLRSATPAAPTEQADADVPRSPSDSSQATGQACSSADRVTVGRFASCRGIRSFPGRSWGVPATAPDCRDRVVAPPLEPQKAIVAPRYRPSREVDRPIRAPARPPPGAATGAPRVADSGATRRSIVRRRTTLMGVVAAAGAGAVQGRSARPCRHVPHSEPDSGDGHVGIHHAHDPNDDAGGAAAGLYPDRLVEGAQGACGRDRARGQERADSTPEVGIQDGCGGR